MPEATEGPTVLRILLGSQLRRLRESRGISAQAAAKAIRGSESKISRIELGRNSIREIDVLDLLTFYGVGAVEREQLLTLAEQANRPGWWHRFNDILRILTVFSIVFLPATLIASIWGMNVGLPGGGDPSTASTGMFWGIIVASVVLVVGMIGLFKYKRWL